MRLKLFSAASILVLTAGCVTDNSAMGDYFQAGFSDGCRTGEAQQASFSVEEFRNASLFKTEASYRSGWRSGYNQCNRVPTMTSRPGDLGERSSF